MSETTSPTIPWITDPDAIDTIVALGLLPGDEVQIHSGDPMIMGVSCDLDGMTGVVNNRKQELIGKPWDGYHVPVCCVRVEGHEKRRFDWLLCRKNIKAWRRPVKRHE